MEDIYIGTLIEEYKKELEEVGYKITDENIEEIILGFIKISNSMLDSEIQKIDNEELKKFILMSSPIPVKFIKNENVLDSFIYDFDSEKKKDIKIKFKFNFNKVDNFNEIIQKKLNLLNKDENLFKTLENIQLKSKLGENLLKHISKNDIKKFLESSEVMEKFNRGELTEKENQLIINFLNN